MGPRPIARAWQYVQRVTSERKEASRRGAGEHEAQALTPGLASGKIVEHHHGMGHAVRLSEGVHSGSPHVWRKPAMVLGLVALAVSLAGFGWTLNGHFVGDDFAYVGRFYNYPLAQW